MEALETKVTGKQVCPRDAALSMEVRLPGLGKQAARDDSVSLSGSATQRHLPGQTQDPVRELRTQS